MKILFYVLFYTQLALADSLSPITIDYCINKNELPANVKISPTKYFEHLLNIETDSPITFQYNGKDNSRVPKKLQSNHFPFLILDQNIQLQRDSIDFNIKKELTTINPETENQKMNIVRLTDLALPGINIFTLYLNGYEEIKFESKIEFPIAYYKDDQFFQNTIIIEKIDKNIQIKFAKPTDLFDLNYLGNSEEEALFTVLSSAILKLKQNNTITFVKVFEKNTPDQIEFINNHFTLTVNKNTCSGFNVVSDKSYSAEDIEIFKSRHKELKPETLNTLINLLNQKQFKVPIIIKDVFNGNGFEVLPCSTFGLMIKKSFNSYNTQNLFSPSYESILYIPEFEKSHLNYTYNNNKSKVTIFKRYRKSQDSIDMRDIDCGIKCPNNIANKKKISKYQSVIEPNEKLDTNSLFCFSL